MNHLPLLPMIPSRFQLKHQRQTFVSLIIAFRILSTSYFGTITQSTHIHHPLVYSSTWMSCRLNLKPKRPLAPFVSFVHHFCCRILKLLLLAFTVFAHSSPSVSGRGSGPHARGLESQLCTSVNCLRCSCLTLCPPTSNSLCIQTTSIGWISKFTFGE